jgi:hypothetical protein
MEAVKTQRVNEEFLYNKTNQQHQFPKFTPAWNKFVLITNVMHNSFIM